MQFEIVLWNGDGLRFIGRNPQESLTIIFHFSKRDKLEEKLKRREIKGVEINGAKVLVYYEETVAVKATGMSYSTTK